MSTDRMSLIELDFLLLAETGHEHSGAERGNQGRAAPVCKAAHFAFHLRHRLSKPYPQPAGPVRGVNFPLSRIEPGL